MITALIAVSSFVLAVAVLAKLIPGKTDKDLVFEPDEILLYECGNLHILRRSKLGRPVVWPGSKIQITNKRVVFSQKGLMSTTYVIREVAVRQNNPPQSWKGMRRWGLVPIFPYHKNDFSVITREDKPVIVFTNDAAPNLDRMEIAGVASVEKFMQAIA
ncbi:MAG: hypothetical protein M3347_11975 [Armatimonadota bacterium]|nr:hypothetical protein [Armatimonadota bacterium]